jgi:hypothetical protein
LLSSLNSGGASSTFISRINSSRVSERRRKEIGRCLSKTAPHPFHNADDDLDEGEVVEEGGILDDKEDKSAVVRRLVVEHRAEVRAALTRAKKEADNAEAAAAAAASDATEAAKAAVHAAASIERAEADAAAKDARRLARMAEMEGDPREKKRLGETRGRGGGGGGKGASRSSGGSESGEDNDAE